jgi:hypothetical protein
LSEREHAARKKHRCNICGHDIEIGERYVAQSNIYDGELYRFKHHGMCLAAYDFVDPQWAYADEGATEEGFYEALSEMGWPYTPAHRVGLAVSLAAACGGKR